MDSGQLNLWMNIIGLSCWPICFWWMHRISREQNAVLKQLREQGTRIEHFSKEEHQLVKELHPRVNDIKENIQQIADATTHAPPKP